MKLYSRILFIFCAYLLFLTFPIGLQAQSDIPEIYFCVEPKAEDSDPYLIEFWDSIVFGIVIPEDATVSIYSNAFYSGALYTVNTNARNGGYIVTERLADFDTVLVLTSDNPCLDEETEDLFASLPYRAIPMPVSKNHVLVVQHEGDSEIENPLQRVMAFSFGIGGETPLRNIQVVQISELDTFLNFRYFDLDANIPFIVIANKDFGVGQSLPDADPPEFSRERPSDIRSFVKSDLAEVYGFDIFEFAREVNARIYIGSGLIDNYRGAYVRVSIAPDTVERVPPMQPDVMVRALPDGIGRIMTLEQLEGNLDRINIPFRDSPAGQISGGSMYRIIEVEDNTGQLIIDFDGNPAIVESWMVEAVEQE